MKFSHLLLLLVMATFALIPTGRAQQKGAPPIIPSAIKVEPELPSKELAVLPAPVAAVPAPAAPAAPATVAPVTRSPGKGIMLNFQGAALTDVLNYLSEAAGFVIVQEVVPTGTVNIVSRQPISAEEAIDLLNAVLVEKGYVAIRNGRILKIINRKDAQKRDLPVQMGSDPEQIPRKDEMVTQILPLRYGEAAKLVENIRPLLSDTATISANEGSNAILLTDTQTNIRRIAQIVRAVDTSVAGISTIHVYPLQFADAKELATVLTQLFPNDTGNGQGNNNNGFNRGGGGGGGGGRRFGGGFGPGGGAPAAPQSEARQAAMRVVAVADQQSNSVIVSAPDEMITIITDIVTRIDTSITDITNTRIFHLEHADAMETADILSSLYGSNAGTTSNRNRQGNGNKNGQQGQGQQGGGQGGGGNGGPSQRALLESQVVAVADPRTNSLLVTATNDTMAQIAEMVGRLDASDTKKQHVYIHSLEHADADSVANVLRGMLGDQSAITNSSQSGANRLSTRSSNGAAMNTNTQTSNSGSRR